MIPLDELLGLSQHFDDPVLLVGCLLAMGLGIGVLTGMFGVGGGFLITPILESVFGFNFTIAVGSGLASIAGTGAAGAARHGRLGNLERKTIVLLVFGSVPGALLGAELHEFMREILGEHFAQVMRGLFVALMLAAALLVWKAPERDPQTRSLLQRLPVGPFVNLRRAGLEGVSLPGLVAVGLGVGVLVGLLGVGGGVLFMPVLILVVGMSAHQAVGTSLGVVLCSAIVATMRYGLTGQVSLWIAMSILTGSAVGIQIGSWICTRLRPQRLRRGFAVLVVAAAILLVVRMTCGDSRG